MFNLNDCFKLHKNYYITWHVLLALYSLIISTQFWCLFRRARSSAVKPSLFFWWIFIPWFLPKCRNASTTIFYNQKKENKLIQRVFSLNKTCFSNYQERICNWWKRTSFVATFRSQHERREPLFISRIDIKI